MIVTEKTVDINTLEREIFEICCEMGRAMFRAALESYNADLQEKRDRPDSEPHQCLEGSAGYWRAHRPTEAESGTASSKGARRRKTGKETVV